MTSYSLNPNPIVHAITQPRSSRHVLLKLGSESYDELSREAFDREEVFDLIRDINDPEHPLTLEQLNVAQLQQIEVDDERNRVCVEFTPTIPHCSMATLIGLSIRVKLLRSLPSRFKVIASPSPCPCPLPCSSPSDLPLAQLTILYSLVTIHTIVICTDHTSYHVFQVDVRIAPGTHASEAAGMPNDYTLTIDTAFCEGMSHRID